MDEAIRTKRIYEPKAADDGVRILVDRLWPRGLTKAEAALDLWMKDAAPSTELRKWFDHRPDRWQEFRARYAIELQSSAAIEPLRKLRKAGPITLLYAARDQEHNEAIVLAAFLKHELTRPPA
jgi:uncharacterized protein YeaO (DUF488 family)